MKACHKYQDKAALALVCTWYKSCPWFLLNKPAAYPPRWWSGTRGPGSAVAAPLLLEVTCHEETEEDFKLSHSYRQWNTSGCTPALLRRRWTGRRRRRPSLPTWMQVAEVRETLHLRCSQLHLRPGETAGREPTVRKPLTEILNSSAACYLEEDEGEIICQIKFQSNSIKSER